MESFVTKFATYLHDYWVQERQDEGWVYGPEYVVSKQTNPKIRPFHTLPQLVRHTQTEKINDLTIVQLSASLMINQAFHVNILLFRA